MSFSRKGLSFSENSIEFFSALSFLGLEFFFRNVQKKKPAIAPLFNRPLDTSAQESGVGSIGLNTPRSVKE